MQLIKINNHSTRVQPKTSHSFLLQGCVWKVTSGGASRWCWAFSSASTAACCHKCQECSLLPCAAGAQCHQGGKQLMTLISLLLLAGVAIAVVHFVALCIWKEKDEMMLH